MMSTHPPSLDLTFCHEIFENCHKWYIESSLRVVVNVKYLATGQILCIWNPSQRKEFLCDWCDCLVGHSLVLPGHLSLLRPPTSSPLSSPASSWLVIAGSSLVTPPQTSDPPHHSFPHYHSSAGARRNMVLLAVGWWRKRRALTSADCVHWVQNESRMCRTAASYYPLLSDWGRPGHQLNHQNPPYLQPPTSQYCNMPRCYTSHRKHSTLRCQMFR